jgi:hypothetical protein
MANPWADNTLENAVALYNFITVPINDLATQVAGVGTGFLGEATGLTTVTLTAGNTNYAAATTGFVFTLATQRRIRLWSQGQFTMGTGGTLGRYYIRAGYNTGTTPVIANVLYAGTYNHVVVGTVGAPGMNSGSTEGTVLLAAGTYCAYPVVQRVSGGTTTDSVLAQNFAVYDVGAV